MSSRSKPRTSQRRPYNSKDKFTGPEIVSQIVKSVRNMPIKQGKSIKRSIVNPIANTLYSVGDAAIRMASRSARRKQGGSGKGSRKKRRTSRSP